MENLMYTGKEINYGGDKPLIVNRLSVVDIFKFAKLLGKLGKGAVADLASQFNLSKAHDESGELTEEDAKRVEEQKSAQAQQIGFALFGALSDLEDDLLDFLAGLTNVSLAEFKKLPPDVALEVLFIVADGEDLKRFFDKARALSAKFLPQTQA